MVSELEYKRIAWHSRRGMLELDLILVPFVEKHFRHLVDADQRLFIQLLEQEDTDLFRWFLQAEPAPDPQTARMVALILEAIRAH